MQVACGKGVRCLNGGRNPRYGDACAYRVSGLSARTHVLRVEGRKSDSMNAFRTAGLLCALGAAACSTANAATFSTEARATGDLSNAPAARTRAADTRITKGCGAGELTRSGIGQVSRFPYLQQVTTDSAEVVLTTKGATPRVQLTTPDGTLVRWIPVERDPTALDVGSTQWIARAAALQPNTLYCYEVSGLVTRTGFVTAPAPRSGSATRFVAFGDSGTGGPGQRAVLAQIRTVPFDFIVHTGDVAYSEGTLPELETEHFAVYRDVLSKFPSFMSYGNHDDRSGGAYRSVFSLPTNGGPDAVERRYSFNWGDVHFVALDTTRINSAQAAWLDRDLTENHLPWVVAFAHEPPFSSGAHGPNRAFQATFTPVLERHHVNLVLSGHEHDYERFKPINGVHYVVTGGGGKTRPVGRGANTAFSESVLHFVYVETQNSTLGLHAIDATGREFDSLVLRH